MFVIETVKFNMTKVADSPAEQQKLLTQCINTLLVRKTRNDFFTTKILYAFSFLIISISVYNSGLQDLWMVPFLHCFSQLCGATFGGGLCLRLDRLCKSPHHSQHDEHLWKLLKLNPRAVAQKQL